MTTNRVKVSLYVTPQYELSAFLKGCAPEDTEYVLDYGENVLREHKAIASKGVLSENLTAINQTLKNKTDEAHSLKSQLLTAKQSAKHDAQNITLEYSGQIESLKRELKEVRAKSAKGYKDEVSEVVSALTQEYQDKLKRLSDQHATEIQNIRNQNQNMCKLDLQRLNQQLTDQLKLNKDLQGALVSERTKMNEEHSTEIQNIKTQNQNMFKLDLQRLNHQLTEQLKINKDLQGALASERTKMNDEHNRMKSELRSDMERRSKAEQEVSACEINRLTGLIKDIRLEMKERESCLLDVRKIVKYYEFENTATKGSKGEKKVQEIIKAHYNVASIKDTSGTAHKGDIWLTLPNLQCLIEVKNKRYVTEDDVKKFVSDVGTNQKDINCALFISLESENIPTKGRFHIDILNTLPVIYMYKYDNASISFAIESLIFLTDKFSKLSKKSKQSEERSTDMVNAVSSAGTMMYKEVKRLNKMIVTAESQVKQLQLMKKNMTSEVLNIKTVFNDCDVEPNSTADSPDEEDTKDPINGYTNEEITKVKTWTSENKKVPTRSDIATILNITQYEVDKRGVRHLQTMMKGAIKKIGESMRNYL